MKRILCTTLLTSLLIALPIRADDPKVLPEPVNLEPPCILETCDPCCTPRQCELMLGYRTWFSWGNSHDTVTLSNGALSEFRFTDTYSTVYEFNIDAAFRSLVARVDIGFGGINEGLFEEEVNQPGPVNPPTNLSDDGLFYVNVDAGYRLFDRRKPGCCGEPCKRCALDLLVGYQHWRETYDPFDASGLVFSDEYQWDSVRVGGRGLLQYGRYTLHGRVMFVPWTHFESVVTQPSGVSNIFIEGEGGFGVHADLTLSYRIWKGLSAEIGYQVFYMDSGDGTFDVTGTPTLPFNDAGSTRHGILAGLNWRF